MAPWTAGASELAVTKRTLTQEERALLDEVLASRDPVLRLLAAEMVGGRILTIAEANALRDAVGDELASTGVDEATGEVNERGVRLDDLIDRIARLSEFHDA